MPAQPAAPRSAARLDHLLARHQRGELLACLTAYTYPQARLLDEAGADLLLCGDSLGMMILGLPDTVEVTMADMIRHTQAVARGRENALLLADLPYGSDVSAELALENAQVLIEAGADAVKLEGASAKQAQIAAITAAGIPLCGHLGMLPQLVREEGGYQKKGKDADAIATLVAEAQLLEQLGAFAVVLESMTSQAAETIAQAVQIPCIGIGTGSAQLAGQIRVIDDVCGSYPWFVPPFANPHAQVAETIQDAARTFVQAAHQGSTNP